MIGENGVDCSYIASKLMTGGVTYKSFSCNIIATESNRSLTRTIYVYILVE